MSGYFTRLRQDPIDSGHHYPSPSSPRTFDIGAAIEDFLPIWTATDATEWVE
jgi:hypothetical protein